MICLKAYTQAIANNTRCASINIDFLLYIFIYSSLQLHSSIQSLMLFTSSLYPPKLPF